MIVMNFMFDDSNYITLTLHYPACIFNTPYIYTLGFNSALDNVRSLFYKYMYSSFCGIGKDRSSKFARLHDYFEVISRLMTMQFDPFATCPPPVLLFSYHSIAVLLASFPGFPSSFLSLAALVFPEATVLPWVLRLLTIILLCKAGRVWEISC